MSETEGIKTRYDFGVLGPLRVVVGGEVRMIGPRQHRVLLAALLLRANRPVPLNELIDRLWPTAPPGGARRTVQTYAMRLRKELGAAGRLIKTSPEGYVIELSRHQLDLGRFTKLTANAATRRAEGNLSAARDDLRTALAEWRGTPLSDLASSALTGTEVPRLLELRHRALEQSIELDLALGAAGDVVAELRTLIAEHPLHEPFRVLLMRALCQQSRHAEAVAAFHDADRVLGEELGVEPGRELRRRYAEALAGATGETTTGGAVPDLARLRDLLAEALAILTPDATHPSPIRRRPRKCFGGNGTERAIQRSADEDRPVNSQMLNKETSP